MTVPLCHVAPCSSTFIISMCLSSHSLQCLMREVGEKGGKVTDQNREEEGLLYLHSEF